MPDTQAQEAARLAALLDAEQVRTVDADVMHSQAAALLRSQAARIAELERELARMREPLSDEQIRALCKESWVFDTAQKWVRAIEAAHGITKTGGGV